MGKKQILELKPVARRESVVTGERFRFTVLTDRLIRLEYQEQGQFLDEPTQTVLCRDFPSVAYRVMEDAEHLEIVTDQLHLYYDKKPFSREGLTIQLKGGYHAYGSSWSYGDPVEDLKGTARTLDMADGAIELEPGLLSRQGFTVLDDSRSALIGQDLWPKARTGDSVDLYFFGYGHDYLQCLRDFYRLSGPTPLLPRFALGNWWSRFYRYTEESYLSLMERFREKGIPFSTAVIDMDWHLTDIPKKYGSGWTGYTWNRELFPDPERFLNRLHEMGMRATLNVHPADGVRAHEDAYLEMAKELGIDYENEDKIPFDASSRAFLEAYFRYLHHPLEEQGVDFWWLDWQQGSRGGAPGIDTLWLLNHLHFLDSGRDGKIPLTFSRYGGIGSHRYPVGFSGDTYTTWASLDFQPYFTANASNAGYSWWSHDIGGHMGGRKDDELTVRWVQFGVFSPIMRLHSTSNAFYGKEPWNFNMQAEKILTDFLRLRHRLIPYLYSMNYLTHREGLPLMQPMYYRNDVEEAYTVPNEYWFGTEMIVCPITKPADQETLLGAARAWLPEGLWYDFFTGQLYRGDRRLDLYRSLETIPVLVKAGGIVPLAKEPGNAHLGNPEELELHVFHGADGSFDLYEDQEGQNPVITRFRYRSGAHPSLSIHREGEGTVPQNRRYEIRFRGIGKPEAVGLSVAEAKPTWSYDPETKELRVWVNETGADLTVEFSLDQGEPVCPDRKKYLYEMLHRAQIEYDIKRRVYEELCREHNGVRLLGKLYQMNLKPELLGAIVEQLVSES